MRFIERNGTSPQYSDSCQTGQEEEESGLELPSEVLFRGIANLCAENLFVSRFEGLQSPRSDLRDPSVNSL